MRKRTKRNRIKILFRDTRHEDKHLSHLTRRSPSRQEQKSMSAELVEHPLPPA